MTERVLLQDRLVHQASHDALAGLPNRVLLLERLGQEVTRDAVAVAERLHAAKARSIPLAAGEAASGTSTGIALSTPDRSDPESLLAAADAAMYRAKQAGKGRYALASSAPAADA